MQSCELPRDEPQDTHRSYRSTRRKPRASARGGCHLSISFSVFQVGAPGLKERGLPTPSRKYDASRPRRKPTRWETTAKFHPPVLPDSAVRAHVSRSTGRSSPAPNGGFVDPKGRPVDGAHKTPRRANRGREPHQSPTLNERTRQGEQSRVGSVTQLGPPVVEL